jgi:hypothetical protein
VLVQLLIGLQRSEREVRKKERKKEREGGEKEESRMVTAIARRKAEIESRRYAGLEVEWSRQ